MLVCIGGRQHYFGSKEEGGVNSKYLHRFMYGRRRNNSVHGIDTNDVRVKCVRGVRETMFNYFKNYFKSFNFNELGMNNFQFKALKSSDETQLVLTLSGVLSKT